MSESPAAPAQAIPPRAILISIVALSTPALVHLLSWPSVAQHEALLWLLVLVPVFLFAYYRGWRGTATAVAVGMVALVGIQVGLQALGRGVPDRGLLVAVVVADIAIAVGIGAVTELLHRERFRAEHLALTDELTGIPNRRYARMFLATEFAAAQRGRHVSVALFDLDGFKQFNDRYGHGRGDEVLRTFANVLAGTTRRTSLSARFGGEEFITILSSCDVKGARVFANRVREAFGEAQGNGGEVTVSVGISTFRLDQNSPDAMIAAADRALYEAKAEGRNRVCVFGMPTVAAVVGAESAGDIA